MGDLYVMRNRVRKAGRFVLTARRPMMIDGVGRGGKGRKEKTNRKHATKKNID